MKRIHLSLLLLAFATAAYSDPRQWDTEGVPVRAVSIIEDFSSATRTDGATLVVWSQSLGAVPVVRGQLLSPAGTPQWEEGGITLAQGERRAGYPVAQSVGNEWVIVWQDAEITASGGAELGWYGRGSLRLIRIDDNGNPVWAGGQAGLELAPVTEWWTAAPYVLHESGGGVIVTWKPQSDLWAMRVDADGQLSWTEPVRLKARFSYNLPDLASDQQGGLVFAWWQILSGDTFVFANKLLQDGTFAWNDTLGVAVHTSNQRYTDVGVSADYEGGAYVVWMKSDGIDDPRAQHVSAQGELQWSADGIVLSDLTGNRYIKAIAPSFLDGSPDGLSAVMLEVDLQFRERLVAQKISQNGEKPWGDNGTTICGGEPGEYDFNTTQIISDETGGALCSYTRRDPEQGVFRVALTRVSVNGTLTWGQSCGVEVYASASWNDLTISAPSVHDESAQVLWLDEINVATRAISLQRLDLETGVAVFAEPLTLAESDPGGVRDAQAVKLSNGSTAVSWEFWTDAVFTSRFQIMDVFGNPMFSNEGRLLAHDDAGNPLSAEDCALCPDGSGGFFAAYRSLENGWYRARAVHLNGQGQHLSEADGILIADTMVWNEAYKLSCIPDGLGGCYVTASLFDEFFYLRTVITRINAQCVPQWEEPVVFTDAIRDVMPTSTLPSENNSCIVVYAHSQFDAYRFRAARIEADGGVSWNVEIDGAARTYSDNLGDACSDGENGVYVVWPTENAAGNVYQTRVQRISASGDFVWDEAGLVYADTNHYSRDISCDADVLGNLTVAWGLYDGDDLNIYAQRLSPNGNLLWPANGLVVTSAPRDQYLPKVVSLSDNEVYIVWSDERNVSDYYWEADIYATHLNALGQIRDDSYWQEDGSPVCNYDYHQDSFVAIADGAGGVTVAWLDQRTAFNFETAVFAQRLYDPIFTGAEESPEVASEYSLTQNYPNPFNPTTTIEFALPHAGPTTLVVFDVTGREVSRLIDQALVAGQHRVTFDSRSLASGIYFYSLRSGEFTETMKMILLR